MISLTSNLTLALSATITVALFALLNIKWKSLKNVWVRTISQLIIQIMLLVTVGIGLNIQNGFYSSWSDLFGVEKYKSQYIAPKTINLSKAKITSNGSAILKETFTGKKSHITSSVWLLLPKPIVQAIKDGASQKFPVAVFLSGSPGVPTAWLNGLNLDDQIKEAQSQSTLGNFIAVLPEFNIIPRTDTGCMNIPGKAKVETWLSKDIYNYVINNLPAEINNWVITGYSTGGWCSTMLALRHPGIFQAAAPIAGYFRAEFPFKIEKQTREKLREKYDLIRLAKMNPVKILILSSKEDANSYESSNWFYNSIKNTNQVELKSVTNGGHNFSTWRPLAQEVLRWFAKESL